VILRGKWSRFWPVVLLAAAALSVAVLLLVVDRLTREPPNYSRIEDGLWLGGSVSEPPPGVTAVLNLCEAEDPYQAESHRWAKIKDAEPAPSLDWLREQVGFIENEGAAGRSVYVHCRNGVSRSGMVVVAYLMARERSPLDRALEYVRASRPELRPHPAFIWLLREWERAVAGTDKAAKTATAPGTRRPFAPPAVSILLPPRAGKFFV
jgi:Dual specificity phosphatase, catalytic domain